MSLSVSLQNVYESPFFLGTIYPASMLMPSHTVPSFLPLPRPTLATIRFFSDDLTNINIVNMSCSLGVVPQPLTGTIAIAIDTTGYNCVITATGTTIPIGNFTLQVSIIDSTNNNTDTVQQPFIIYDNNVHPPTISPSFSVGISLTEPLLSTLIVLPVTDSDFNVVSCSFATTSAVTQLFIITNCAITVAVPPANFTDGATSTFVVVVTDGKFFVNTTLTLNWYNGCPPFPCIASEITSPDYACPRNNTCTCLDNTPPPCVRRVDFCTTQPCVYSSCNNTVTAYNCAISCPPGVTGRNCDTPVCFPNCQNGGQCAYNLTSRTTYCRCSTCFVGATCAVSRCPNGQCFSNQAQCACTANNVTGPNCDITSNYTGGDPCGIKSVACQPGSTCVAVSRSSTGPRDTANCYCPPGATGAECQLSPFSGKNFCLGVTSCVNGLCQEVDLNGDGYADAYQCTACEFGPSTDALSCHPDPTSISIITPAPGVPITLPAFSCDGQGEAGCNGNGDCINNNVCVCHLPTNGGCYFGLRCEQFVTCVGNATKNCLPVTNEQQPLSACSSTSRVDPTTAPDSSAAGSTASANLVYLVIPAAVILIVGYIIYQKNRKRAAASHPSDLVVNPAFNAALPLTVVSGGSLSNPMYGAGAMNFAGSHYGSSVPNGTPGGSLSNPMYGAGAMGSFANYSATINSQVNYDVLDPIIPAGAVSNAMYGMTQGGSADLYDINTRGEPHYCDASSTAVEKVAYRIPMQNVDGSVSLYDTHTGAINKAGGLLADAGYMSVARSLSFMPVTTNYITNPADKGYFVPAKTGVTAATYDLSSSSNESTYFAPVKTSTTAQIYDMATITNPADKEYIVPAKTGVTYDLPSAAPAAPLIYALASDMAASAPTYDIAKNHVKTPKKTTKTIDPPLYVLAGGVLSIHSTAVYALAGAETDTDGGNFGFGNPSYGLVVEDEPVTSVENPSYGLGLDHSQSS